MELWQDSCEEEVIQRCQAFLQQSLEINELTRAVAKKNYNSDDGQDNDDEGDSCHDNIGGVLLINNNAMMMMMLIRAANEISSCQANDTNRWEIQQLGILFGSIFLLFSYKSRRGHFHNSQ